MSGLVEQLQMEALDKGNSIADLLRKSKLAAVKLGIKDAVTWIDAELTGYKAEPPEYRRVKGELRWWNPYHGWQPVAVADAELSDLICSRSVVEPVTSLEATLASGGTGYMLMVPSDMVAEISVIFDSPVPITRMSVSVSRGSLVAILERVRGLVFDWALELEAAGISGAGLGFSTKEKAIAMTSHITIGSMSGGSLNTGDVSGTNARLLQAGDDRSVNTTVDRSVFRDLEAAVTSQISEDDDRRSILAATRELEAAEDAAGRLGAYQRFMAAAANHMTVVGPFLPALTSMLGS